jgi:hypothetical protein
VGRKLPFTVHSNSRFASTAQLLSSGLEFDRAKNGDQIESYLPPIGQKASKPQSAIPEGADFSGHVLLRICFPISFLLIICAS